MTPGGDSPDRRPPDVEARAREYAGVMARFRAESIKAERELVKLWGELPIRERSPSSPDKEGGDRGPA